LNPPLTPIAKFNRRWRDGTMNHIAYRALKRTAKLKAPLRGGGRAHGEKIWETTRITLMGLQSDESVKH
jgi:hypothetical protein